MPGLRAKEKRDELITSWLHNLGQCEATLSEIGNLCVELNLEESTFACLITRSEERGASYTGPCYTGPCYTGPCYTGLACVKVLYNWNSLEIG